MGVMTKFAQRLKWYVGAVILAVLGALTAGSTPVSADGITMSPMKTEIHLEPGEIYHGKFSVLSPSTNTTTVKYSVSIRPFYVTEDYDMMLDTVSEANQIMEWITIDDDTTGTLDVEETKDIHFTITVPDDVPDGGQYAAIMVMLDPGESDNSEGIVISDSVAVLHTIFADMGGEARRGGEIKNLSVSGFLFDGDITASSMVYNTGNVHSNATYKLSIYPLFSDEEIHTNEDNPLTRLVMPERVLYVETAWPDTPSFGVYRVVYTVEFEGKSESLTKTVIVCPPWLIVMALVLIAMVVVVIVAWRRRKYLRE